MGQNRDRLIRIIIVAGVIIVGVLLIYQIFLKPKTSSSNANGTTGQTGTTDANGNPLVEYIPTSTTDVGALNLNYAAQGDAQQVIPLGTPPGGSQTVVVGGPGSSGQIGPTSGGTGTVNPPPVVVPPVVVPPVILPPTGVTPPPQPPVTPPSTPPPSNPPTSSGGTHGVPPPPPPRMTTYTIVHGDTLSGIASRYHTTASAIYAANKSTIDAWAAKYNYPIKHNPAWGNYPAAMDNIFPGETLHIPL